MVCACFALTLHFAQCACRPAACSACGTLSLRRARAFLCCCAFLSIVVLCARSLLLCACCREVSCALGVRLNAALQRRARVCPCAATLRAFFSNFGEVLEATVMKDTVTKRSRGFGFIVFSSFASVDRVLAERDLRVDNRKVCKAMTTCSFPSCALFDEVAVVPGGRQARRAAWG